MAGAAGCYSEAASGRAGRARRDSGAAGSLVLRRVDRRERKRGLVRAKKHGTKSCYSPLVLSQLLSPVQAC